MIGSVFSCYGSNGRPMPNPEDEEEPQCHFIFARVIDFGDPVNTMGQQIWKFNL
jgi:hypothetical protein